MSACSRTRHRFGISALIALAAIVVLALPTRAQQAADDATVVIDPADGQRELAMKLFPGLLEMGLDVTPSDDQVRSVLAAVNALRRQDNQRQFAQLDADAAAYVEGKLAAYRTQHQLTLRIQGALDALGFSPGPLDGIYGPLTTDAVRRYQRSTGLSPSGQLTAEQVDALEMRSIDRIMRPPETATSGATGPAADNGDAMVAAPAANAPEIDPDLLDYIGR
ncbi:MAG: peptidoglycan-binding domain-containing protein [Gemmatimonas sp.]